MFRMTVEGQFSAAHAIRNYPGPCCQLHGHNYRVVVHLEGTELDQLGMLIDYTDVKGALTTVLAPLDHAYLNDLPDFSTINPTSEQIACLLYHRLKDTLLNTDDLRRRIRLSEVIVFESERQGVGYSEE
ncbi:MAG TPA: 6-carboxytetrahydropterin synthase QueD [Armatimonadota bacterium]|nr:6-carboxytetrahydropterin synthase QueD [Armatimonadota bacterium]